VSKFTPGPWRFDYFDWKGRSVAWTPYVSGNSYTDRDGTAVSTGVCIVHGNQTSLATTEANARLIAAAPDLLAGCMALMKLGREMDKAGIINDPSVNAIRAAISKAMGVASAPGTDAPGRGA
jgi:hypothetical protein